MFSYLSVFWLAFSVWFGGRDDGVSILANLASGRIGSNSPLSGRALTGPLIPLPSRGGVGGPDGAPLRVEGTPDGMLSRMPTLLHRLRDPCLLGFLWPFSSAGSMLSFLVAFHPVCTTACVCFLHSSSGGWGGRLGFGWGRGHGSCCCGYRDLGWCGSCGFCDASGSRPGFFPCPSGAAPRGPRLLRHGRDFGLGTASVALQNVR